MAELFFAGLESLTAQVSLGVLANVRLTDGLTPFEAVLDRGVERIGENSLTPERRDRITVSRAVACRFRPGMEVALDPATYSVDQRLAAQPSSWRLDSVDGDDGHIVSWWLR